MSLEQKINYQLNKFPVVKKVVKRVYQRGMYAVSKKIKSEGNIKRISPDDKDHEYFFGYYDKSPWDITDRYVLCLRANNTWSDVSPREKADILLIDTEKDENSQERVKVLAETNSWNVQQGCMLQWLGPDYGSNILYNDYRDGKYISVILNLKTMNEKIIPAPVYTVSSDGKFALTLDFSRLYNLRPGYGYYNVPETTKDIPLPDTTAIWKVSLETGEVTELLKYTDFAEFQPRYEMKEKGTVHKVNHLMLSPNNKRFMALYRWFNGERKYTRLITCNIDGTDMYVLSDDDMVSHCFWKDDTHIIAFENKKKSGTGYYLMKDKTQEYIHCWPEMTGDGHPSFSPDRKLVVTDTYPNRSRISSIKIMDGDVTKNEINEVVKVFSPFKYDNDTRCDLHPRWNHGGDKISFDAVFDGHRGLYAVDVTSKNNSLIINANKDIYNSPKYTIVTPMYNSFDLMERYFDSFENQTFKNFEIIIVDDASTDNSYSRAIKYCRNSSLNISVLKSSKNLGPGNARNMGMDAAKGIWITFVDNDDWVEYSLLEEIDNKIEKYKANCLIFDYFITDGNTKKAASSMYYGKEGVISLNECIKYARNHSIGKVYNLAKCRNAKIRYPLVRRCEDVAFVARAIDACGSAYYLKKPLYNYLQRPTSLSNNTKLDHEDMLRAFNILDEALGDKYPNELKEKSVTDILYGALLMMCKSRKTNIEIKSYIKNYEFKYPMWYKCQIVKYLGKSKRFFLLLAKYKLVSGMKFLAFIHAKLIG